MWYFAWILGLGFALTFGILNALWNEFFEDSQLCEDVDCEPAGGVRDGDEVVT